MHALLLRSMLVASIGLASATAAAQSSHFSKAIVPGNVRAANGGVTGSFRIVRARNGIPSTGTGGACLVADSQRACRIDDDCRDLRAAHHPNGWAYCLRPKSNLGARTCWIRPGRQSDYCRVSPVSPYPLDEALMLPVVDGDPRGDGKPVRWLVHGCLNRFDPASGEDHPGCKLSDPTKMRTWNGKATTVRP